MNIPDLILTLAALYCAVMYGVAAFRTIVHREDHELLTFHLGLCFVLAVGFLSLG